MLKKIIFNFSLSFTENYLIIEITIQIREQYAVNNVNVLLF